MNEFKKAIEQVIWNTLQKHYNIDPREPRVLTYKHIQMQDPIGDLAQQLTDITEELIKEAINQLSTPPEIPKEEEKEEDNYGEYGSYPWYGDD